MKINGLKLKEAREAADISLKDLAVVADLTYTRMWQLETEWESNINENIAKAIAKKLKVATSALQ